MLHYFVSCSIIFFLTSFSISVVAREITVKSGTKINTIQKALNSAQNGDIIKVTESTYYVEDILIDKSISLIGIGKPVLDGQKKSNVIIISAPQVTINGFVIRNSGFSNIKDKAGIRVEKCDRVKILNNLLENTCFGIYLAKVNGGTISGNIIRGNNSVIQSGNGIHLWYSNHINIYNNKIYGQRDGIYFEFATFCEISHNLSENNHRYGLHFMFSNNDNYAYNIFRNNGSGVAVMYTKHIRMINNTFERNWGSSSYGLLLKDISRSYISNNTFAKNTSGIFMEGTNEVKVERNNFLNNGLAVRMLANCEKDTFLLNNFLGNTFDFTTNGSENLNYLKGNYWDKYSGYDLNRDGKGDLPYRPVSLYSQIIEKLPSAVFLLRSFVAELLDEAEKALPSLSYVNLYDTEPSMHIIR
ncbi:MAG: nitrous oxide reductase family maturation protein NosD [Bacteroidales bacterium]|nr:nitrous oxide reductase family maturation protein NosD [Bacteroidales bacterium]